MTSRLFHRLASEPSERVRAALRLAGSDLDVLDIFHIAAEAPGGMRSILQLPSEEYYRGPLEDFIMSSFLFPYPSRFSDGRFGVLYGADTLRTAAVEHGYHLGRFARDARLESTVFHRCRVLFRASETLKNIHNDDVRVFDPRDYGVSQQRGFELYSARVKGITYPSVRKKEGVCAGIFIPRIVGDVERSSGISYTWNGERLEAYSHPIDLG